MNLSGVSVAVVGMARSGMAALELLREKGADVWAVDQNPMEIAGQTVLPQSDASLAKAEWIILSPGVPADLDIVETARRRGARVIGDVELASWFLKGPIIGITGSNGKTTTTALTGHVLKASGIPVQVGGNIGTPTAAMVKTSRAEQWNVLELSSFQLETVETLQPRIGAALNLTPDHLDRHYTMTRYAAAKGRLFARQTETDFAVLNADDPFCVAYSGGRGHAVWFSSTRKVAPGAFLQHGEMLLDGQELMQASEVPMLGVHNLENTMAAAAITHLAGASHVQIREAVMTFPGVEHRLEFVCEANGVAWYNDSKATNVDAALKAIAAFDGKLWIILGGKDKNSDYTPLAAPLRENAHGALLIGAAAEKIAAQLKGAIPLIACGTLEAAVCEARTRANPGDRVLLAPACASFDQFENFEHRGREFKRLVKDAAGKPLLRKGSNG